jgi:hypothetical protein
MRSRLLPLLLALMLSGCAYMGSYGLGHALVAAGGTAATKVAFDKPEWGALFVCGGYVFKEIEESDGFKREKMYSGVWDVIADMGAPCLTGLGFTLVLK